MKYSNQPFDVAHTYAKFTKGVARGVCVSVVRVCVCIITAHELKSFWQAKIFCSLKQFEVICSQFTNVCPSATAKLQVWECVWVCVWVCVLVFACVYMLECNYACEWAHIDVALAFVCQCAQPFCRVTVYPVKGGTAQKWACQAKSFKGLHYFNYFIFYRESNYCQFIAA